MLSLKYTLSNTAEYVADEIWDWLCKVEENESPVYWKDIRNPLESFATIKEVYDLDIDNVLMLSAKIIEIRYEDDYHFHEYGYRYHIFYELLPSKKCPKGSHADIVGWIEDNRNEIERYFKDKGYTIDTIEEQ